MNWILLGLIVLCAALGAAVQLHMLALSAPPPALFAVAAILAFILFVRLLPLRARRVVVFLVVLVGLAGFAGGLYYFQYIFKPVMLHTIISQAMAPKPTTVTADVAKVEKWTPRFPAIGTLRAYQGIDVAPQVGGLIRAIHFQSAEEVPAGAPLIEIDDRVDQADLKNNLAQLKNADVSLERQQQLVIGGNTAKAQVDTATAARDSAAANVERTRAIIAQKAVGAPFAGRLGIRKVDVGQYVSAGMSLVTLQQLDPIYLDFQAPEQVLGQLAVGQEASATIDAFPGQNFAGKIRSIDARVSSDTRNLLVRAEFPNPDHKLLPGMFANIEVVIGAAQDVVTLPRTGVSFSLYGDNVFVVKPAPPKEGEAQAATPDAGPKVVERRFVRVGETRGERVSITEGVAAGDLVVTSGQIKLQPNFPVIVDNSAALTPPAQTQKQ
jgi:membrane fusion protein (multidrug efflux system)